jgi:hypothetical protein
MNRSMNRFDYNAAVITLSAHLLVPIGRFGVAAEKNACGDIYRGHGNGTYGECFYIEIRPIGSTEPGRTFTVYKNGRVVKGFELGTEEDEVL